MTATLRYDAGAWPWVATGLLGTSVAVERVLAGRHFYTDVIVGAVAGTVFGVTIPLLHRRGDGAPRLTAVPVRGGVAVALVGRR
jgi:membrane-associated phospholipid phosphatase